MTILFCDTLFLKFIFYKWYKDFFNICLYQVKSLIKTFLSLNQNVRLYWFFSYFYSNNLILSFFDTETP